MGQAHSQYKRSGGFWNRRKPKGTHPQQPPGAFIKMSPPPPEPDKSPVQMDQSSANADTSSTTANTTPALFAPFTDMHGDAMAMASDNQTGEVNKTEQQTSSPHDQLSAASQPDTQGDTMAGISDGKIDEPDRVEIDSTDQQTSNPHDPPMALKPDQPDQPTQPAQKPSPKRPALKREFTPPHRIKIWSHGAWQVERAYSSVHDHMTKTLNEIRKQQQESNQKAPAAMQLELDIYKAADSCTLSLEYLVGHFSTRFFHYAGPPNIMGMMATIDADATKLDDLRMMQRQMPNYGYNLEKKIIQTEGHIRQLAELAKHIKESPADEEEEEEDESEDEDEDDYLDAEGETDPEYDFRADGGGNHS